jgi:hypothetical protein
LEGVHAPSSRKELVRVTKYSQTAEAEYIFLYDKLAQPATRSVSSVLKKANSQIARRPRWWGAVWIAPTAWFRRRKGARTRRY